MSMPRKSSFLMTSALDSLSLQRRYLYVFTYLAALTALQVLHLALSDMRMNLWLSSALTCGFVFSYFVEPRHRALTTYGVSTVSAVAFVLYFLRIWHEYGMVGTYLGIMLGVFLVLASFKAYAPGDHRFILMICVAFLIYSSAACYDLKYMLALPVIFIFASCAMYIASQVDVAVRVSETASVPLAVRLEFGRGFGPVLMRAVGGTILLSVLAYMLAPHGMRQDRPLQLTPTPRVSSEDLAQAQSLADPSARRKPGEGGESYTGIGEDFDLSGSGRLENDPTPVLQVKCHRSGYLRAQVYDVFTGSQWVQSRSMELDYEPPIPITTQADTMAEEAAGRGGRLMIPLMDFPSQTAFQHLQDRATVALSAANVFSMDNTVDLSAEIIRQEVRLLEPLPPFYFAMYQPGVLLNVAVVNDNNEALDTPVMDKGSALRADHLEKWHPRGFGYTVESIEVQATPKQLQAVSLPGPKSLVAHYTKLFMEGDPALGSASKARLNVGDEAITPVSRRLRNFAVSLVDQAARHQPGRPLGTWDKVQAIYDYLSNVDEFSYSRDYESPPPGGEVTENFLFQQRTGFCRQYASAMAVLCRLNGIPARVVSGFSPGARSLIDNAFIYRNSNAHAWVEVYFDGYGWVLFDPTPSSRDALNKPAAAQYFQDAVDFLQELFVLDPAGTQRSIAGALKALWQLALLHWRGAVAVLLGLPALCVGVAVLRRLPLRRKTAQLAAANAVVAAWFEARQSLAHAGLGSSGGETARQFCAGAAARLSSVAEHLAELLPLYESAAYSPRWPDDAATERARGCAGAIKAAVLAELAARRSKRRG